jgi:hypothetical protein
MLIAALLLFIADPEVMVLYYQRAHIRLDPNLYNHIAMSQTIALTRLVRAIERVQWVLLLICKRLDRQLLLLTQPLDLVDAVTWKYVCNYACHACVFQAMRLHGGQPGANAVGRAA